MAEKIILRLKSNHDVVLPEAELVYNDGDRYRLDFDPEGQTPRMNFSTRHWEPVPPPYELPTGLGAVVRGPLGGVYVYLGDDQWVAPSGYGATSSERIKDWEGVTTLSEGVNLDG